MGVVSCQLLRSGTRLEIDEFGRCIVTKVFLVTTNYEGNKGAAYCPGADLEYTVALGSTTAGPDPIPHIMTNIYDNPLLSQYNLDSGTTVTNSPGWNGTTDEMAFLTKKVVEPWSQGEDDPWHWKVTCTWTSMPYPYVIGSGTGTGGGLVFPHYNPLDDPVIERSEYEHFRRRAEFDVNGSAIANSAHDPFNDVIVDDQRPVLVFTKNVWPESAIDALAAQFKNAINSDTFKGHAPKTLKIASITKGTTQQRNKIQFIPMMIKIYKAQIEYGSYGTSQTWDVTKADYGPHHLVGGIKVPPSVQTGTSQGQLLDFVNLDTDGTRLPDGAEPKKKTFQVYPTLPFSGLGL